MTTTPRSISSSVTTASADASTCSTMSSTLSPALCTTLTTFWIAVFAPVMMCASTSSRLPAMPMASRTPSWPSIVNCCGQHVDDAPLRGNAHRARGVDGAVHVLVANLTMTGCDGDDAAAVLRGDVAAGDADHGRVDGHAGHLLGHVHRLGDRLSRSVDLDDRALADPSGGDHTDTQDSETGAFQVCYGAADLGRSEIECENAARTGHWFGLRV